MNDTLPLDPRPVRWKYGAQRTALLGLARTFSDYYVFEPRPGFNPDRAAYRNREVVTRTTVIDGAEPYEEEADQ